MDPNKDATVLSCFMTDVIDKLKQLWSLQPFYYSQTFNPTPSVPVLQPTPTVRDYFSEYKVWGFHTMVKKKMCHEKKVTKR